MRADLVIVGADVYTVDAARRWASAVAIGDGRILAVGTDDDVRDLSGPSTEVLSLPGRMVLPGFQDAHNHACFAGRYRLNCDLHDLHTREEYLDAVAAYARANPGAEWIFGGGWGMASFPGGKPRREDLDAVVRGRPVFLMNADLHAAWVNSRALELAGIDRGTPDPPGGRIERDPDGEPIGTLHEWARDPVARLLPPTTQDTWEESIRIAQRHLHSLGVTAWQDAWVEPEVLRAYASLAEREELTARVVAAQWWQRAEGVGQVERLVEQREWGTVGNLRATSVKIMQDGVPEAFTAAVVEPYIGREDDQAGGLGFSFNDPEALIEAVIRLDVEGFQVHVHAIGDRGIKEALGAFAAAADKNGIRDARHHVTHLQLLDPADIPRFRELRLAATVQPYWGCADDQMVTLTIPFLGPERANRQYAFRSLLRGGVTLAFASDWAISTADPLFGIEVAVTRVDPERRDMEPFIPKERIPLPDAIAAYTMGSAYVNHLDGETGSIEPGKLADLVVLDRDLFDPDLPGPADATVELTIVGGRIVHER